MAVTRANLGSLAPELRLQILEYCPDVPTAASLARVTKAFHETWNHYHEPICHKLLEGSIECYADARPLAEAQVFQEYGRAGHSKQYVSKILTNAKIVKRTCHAFSKTIFYGPGKRMHVWPSPTEHTRFIHIYYLLWTSLTTSNPRTWNMSQDFQETIFDTISDRDYYMIDMFLEWLVHRLDGYDDDEELDKQDIEMLLWTHDPYVVCKFDVSSMAKYYKRKVFLMIHRESHRIARLESKRALGLHMRQFRRHDGWRLLRDDLQYVMDHMDHH
ncbi:MAG: hypothetical protein Q9168_006369 [Polycauliona sp. 1 TL-2023]